MVAGITLSRGHKSDKRDAYGLAEKRRVGSLDKIVFKAPRQFTRLRELSRIHMTRVSDTVRGQARIKSLYRSRGILVAGVNVYGVRHRKEWQNQLPSSIQTRATRDFLDCSYGFRPKRSAHKALGALWRQLMGVRGGWLIELDIQDFFGSLDHGKLRQILRQRIRDGVLLRLIGKWLHAGVMEGGNVTRPEAGTPQGGVVSPILANVFLHEVLDRWFFQDVAPRMRGKAHLVRYADDAVLVFECKEDAKRVMAVLSKRFAKYGLTLHPGKTRMIPFGRSMQTARASPKGFSFLGFMHYWGRSLRGNWVVKRKTASDRFTRALRRIAQWCRRYRHLPVKTQWHMLVRKVRGHYAYYGITGNARALNQFRFQVEHVWGKWLSRRSHRGMTWERFNRLLRRYPLPEVVILHRSS